MAWTDADTVREITGASETDYTDAQIEGFISLAQREVNSKIINKVVREPVQYIDGFRSNDIDGSNRTFFIQNWRGNYFGDTNYDGEVDTSDITVTKYNPATETESNLTISSISVPWCQLTLSAAPSNCDLYITYSYTPIDPQTPDNFLALATAYLASSYMFVGNDDDKIRFGNVSIEPGADGSRGTQFYKKYLSLLDQLTANSMGGGAIWDNMAEII